jgi:general secretion pathway protein H
MTSRFEPAQPAGRPGAAGFTLIEMIVVIAIMALLAASLTVRGNPVSPTTHARAAVRAIAGAMRSARSEAIMSNRSISFTLDSANRRYWWGQSPPETLTADLRVAMLTSRNQMAGDAVGRIRFDPDGGSTGGRVAVAGGDRTWWVGVDWLTGRVSVAEKPR